MIDKIELERLKELRQWVTPVSNTLHTNNFERICAALLVVGGMLIDQMINDKMKLRR